jgi:hypothetical protein
LAIMPSAMSSKNRLEHHRADGDERDGRGDGNDLALIVGGFVDRIGFGVIPDAPPVTEKAIDPRAAPVFDSRQPEAEAALLTPAPARARRSARRL